MCINFVMMFLLALFAEINGPTIFLHDDAVGYVYPTDSSKSPSQCIQIKPVCINSEPYYIKHVNAGTRTCYAAKEIDHSFHSLFLQLINK